MSDTHAPVMQVLLALIAKHTLTAVSPVLVEIDVSALPVFSRTRAFVTPATLVQTARLALTNVAHRRALMATAWMQSTRTLAPVSWALQASIAALTWMSVARIHAYLGAVVMTQAATRAFAIRESQEHTAKPQ